MQDSGLEKNQQGQKRTLYSLRHTYAPQTGIPPRMGRGPGTGPKACPPDHRRPDRDAGL